MFEKEEDANKALNDVNGLSVCGKQLKVSVARPRNFGGKGCKLHISRLPSHYTWEMVNNLFSQVFIILFIDLLFIYLFYTLINLLLLFLNLLVW